MPQATRALMILAFALAGCAQDPSAGPTQSAVTPTADSDAATPSARETPSPPAGPNADVYVALGDSLAVGVGATRPDRVGYVPRIGRALDVSAVENFAVSGETSQSLLDGQQLHAALTRIRSAGADLALVTLDIGGNDLLRLLHVDPCLGAPDSIACRRAVALTLAAFERNYRAALVALREALDASAPEATLAVMTYFNPFSGTDAVYAAGGRLALLGADLALDCSAARASPANRGMNDIIACVGAEMGAVVADVQPRFAGLGIRLTHIGSRDIHANDRGYRVIADVFLAALANERQ